MSNTAMGNAYHDNAKLTWHICARCLAWLGSGEHRFLGKVGCVMPDFSEAEEKEFKAFKDKGIMRCYRCFILGQDCCVVSIMDRFGPVWANLGHVNPTQVPDALTDEFDAVFSRLTSITEGVVERKVCNPAYQEPAPTAAKPAEGAAPAPPPVPKYLVQTGPITADEKREMLYKVRDICGPLSKTLSKYVYIGRYGPVWATLAHIDPI
jgi:hypothetical protein